MKETEELSATLKLASFLKNIECLTIIAIAIAAIAPATYLKIIFVANLAIPVRPLIPAGTADYAIA